MIILDASAALELLLDTSTGEVVRDRLLASDRMLGAPHLLDIEVGHVLRRYERAREITASRAELALGSLADLPLTRYAHTPLLARMWELRANVTFYDAAYLALAEALSATLVTCDVKLAAAPRQHRAKVEVLRG
ncbi:MAG: twitching motility protein PilT [Deltaproteobacteria bacterium RBG_16_71_12]|nr:MAG: twitching motility protein PilT [Deltaproteobacteria bacterium RBG_16_71_12]